MKAPTILESNVVIFSPSGKVMSGDDCTRFKEVVRGHLEEGRNCFIVDCQDVIWMNSYGLAMLIAGMVSAGNAGGRFALANVEPIAEMLERTRLAKVFDVYDSVDAAVRGLTNGSQMT